MAPACTDSCGAIDDDEDGAFGGLELGPYQLAGTIIIPYLLWLWTVGQLIRPQMCATSGGKGGRLPAVEYWAVSINNGS